MIIIKTKGQFIDEIFKFYGKNSEDLKNVYSLAISPDYEVNWSDLYMYIVKNVESRILPPPKFFIDLLPKYRKFNNNKYFGGLIVIELKNGQIYQFTECNGAKTNINDIKTRFEGSIKNIVKYDENAVFIDKENILYKTKQILYQNG